LDAELPLMDDAAGRGNASRGLHHRVRDATMAALEPSTGGWSMTVLLLGYVVAGLVLAALSVPLIRRRVGPNAWYGFRVRRTLQDAAVWYEVNAYAGRRLFVAGLVTAAAALALALVPGLSVDLYALACLAAALVAIGVAIVQSFRYLRRPP
jgi:MFS family permease